MSQATELPQKCVLVVDDSRFVRTTFVTILKASFATKEAADGEDGWKAIQSDPSIVMVFTDLDMPKLNGIGLLGRIRGSSERRIKDLPVVVISGAEEQATKQRALDAGANDFISKSAEAPEVISRLNNVLRLVNASKELEESRQALEREATNDPVTGTFTAHYLVTEGRKHYAHARRHGGELCVLALRVDSYAEIITAAGQEVANLVLARIAKLVTEKVRAEDTVARASESTFMVVALGTTSEQMLAVAQRLQRELSEAKVTYRGTPLKFAASCGVSSIVLDRVDSIEELMKIANERLQSGGRLPVQPAAAALGANEPLPEKIETALRRLEKADWGALGGHAADVIARLQQIARMVHAKRR